MRKQTTNIINRSLTPLLVAGVVFLASCSGMKDDISDLKKDVTDLKGAVSELQSQYSQGKLIISATSYASPAPGGVEIKFSDNSTIKVVNGANGTNGITPSIRVNNNMIEYNITSGYPASGWVSTGVNLKGADGQYTTFQYAVNQSSTTAPTTGWQATAPAVNAGYFLWMRSGVVVPPATTPSWGTAIRLTGEKGATGDQGNSVNLVANTDGFYHIVVTDAATAVLSDTKSAIPCNSENSILSIADLDDGYITITMNDADNTQYKFDKFYNVPTSFELLDTELALSLNAEGKIAFRANPSTADPAQLKLLSNWELDQVGVKTRSGYVTDCPDFALTAIAEVAGKPGQYEATIKCLAVNTAIASYKLALVFNTTVNGKKAAQISTGTFAVTSQATVFVESALNGFDPVTALPNQLPLRKFQVAFNSGYTAGQDNTGSLAPGWAANKLDAAGILEIEILGTGNDKYEVKYDPADHSIFWIEAIDPMDVPATADLQVKVTVNQYTEPLPTTSVVSATRTFDYHIIADHFTVEITNPAIIWPEANIADVYNANIAAQIRGAISAVIPAAEYNKATTTVTGFDNTVIDRNFKAASLTKAANGTTTYKANYIASASPEAATDCVDDFALVQDLVITTAPAAPETPQTVYVKVTLKFSVVEPNAFEVSHKTTAGVFTKNALYTTDVINLTSATGGVFEGVTLTAKNGNLIRTSAATPATVFGNMVITEDPTGDIATPATYKTANATDYNKTFKLLVKSVKYNGKVYSTGIKLAGLADNKFSVKFNAANIVDLTLNTTGQAGLVFANGAASFNLEQYPVVTFNLWNSGISYTLVQAISESRIQGGAATYSLDATLAEYLELDGDGKTLKVKTGANPTAIRNGKVTVTATDLWGVSKTTDIDVKLEIF
ncbi:MAG: DUF4988 domain-containing protein [Rikenellaceae bacterium]|jgi:hypothetical protein|nr:DUF4988 domain-containing protein [Rikenellaceae bacterium]